MASEKTNRKDVFDSNFKEIMEYVSAGKHKDFPGNCRKARRLSNWMHRQFKRTSLPDAEKAKVDELRRHFDDTPREVKEEMRWREYYDRLCDYQKDHHTFVISKKDDEHKKLYHWAADQRKAAKRNKMPEERRCKLRKIGYLS
jgi:hypothetical protein